MWTRQFEEDWSVLQTRGNDYASLLIGPENLYTDLNLGGLFKVICTSHDVLTSGPLNPDAPGTPAGPRSPLNPGVPGEPSLPRFPYK